MITRLQIFWPLVLHLLQKQTDFSQNGTTFRILDDFSKANLYLQFDFYLNRGKKNRYDNWQRFGHFENRGQQQQNNYFYSSPNWTQQQGFNAHRGWRGSSGGHNRGQHGGRFVPRGGNRGHHQHHNNTPRSYFHPSMLEDPWADLMMADNSVSNDSLMPQVGDSLIDPAPDVPDNLESNIEDLSAYSYNEPVEEATDRATSIDHNNDDVDKDINVMSDSMIPQVGDSILERNDAVSSSSTDK